MRVSLSFEKDEAIIVAMLTPEQARRAGAGAAPAIGPQDLAGSERVVISDWRLTIDSILPPESGAPLLSRARHANVGPFELGSEIKAWADVSESLARTSGLGTYKGSFSMTARGHVMVDLGRVENGVLLIVNGKPVDGIDQTGGLVDVSAQSHPGINTIEIRAASTLEGAVQRTPRKIAPFGRDGKVTVLSRLDGDLH